MPHFIIHCSADVLEAQPEQQLNQQVHAIARDSGLFTESDIKLRVQAFDTFSVGGQCNAFIHVFASIMQGRPVEQRAALSKAVVSHLIKIFPQVENIAMNVDEFEKSTYCNRALLARD